MGSCLKISQCSNCSAILANCSVDNPTETNGTVVSGYIAKNSRTKYYYKLAYLSVQFQTNDEIFTLRFINYCSGFNITISNIKQCRYYIFLYLCCCIIYFAMVEKIFIFDSYFYSKQIIFFFRSNSLFYNYLKFLCKTIRFVLNWTFLITYF